MRIGAYQFEITGDINGNLEKILQAISEASDKNIRLLVFSECALTGYPPHDIENSSAVDSAALNNAFKRIQEASDKNDIYIIVGAVTVEENRYYNSAIVFSPDKPKLIYNKRALWGWDKENFCEGENKEIFEIDGFKVGIRICFEVRFPEYFRELYAAHTDLNIILFYDVSESDDWERLNLISAHIKTRAVENICHTLSVNNSRLYQTAPTALYDRSGRTVAELGRHEEKLLVYELNNIYLNFGEEGRKQISDKLLEF